MYGPVLGASTTAVAVLALPNTGSNKVLEVAVAAVLVIGIATTIVSLSLSALAKAHK